MGKDAIFRWINCREVVNFLVIVGRGVRDTLTRASGSFQFTLVRQRVKKRFCIENPPVAGFFGTKILELQPHDGA